MIMKHIIKSFSFAFLCMAGLTSCHCDHFDEPAEPFKVGWVVCTDGEILPFCEYVRSGKDAVAIVYNVNHDFESPISGYAVYLNDLPAAEFADTEMTNQGTSTDLLLLDGNENTWALYSTREEVNSPMANQVFDLWTYGQSAYVPSIAQLKQIREVKDFINPRIEAIGGDILPDVPNETWYWSSTEVSGQSEAKAWLYSFQSGAIQETPKIQAHKARPVITLYR